MVPKGWEVLHLKDVASKIQDGNYGADYPKADEFVASGIPFLTSKVIGGIGTINPDKFDYIKEEKHQSLKKAQIVAGDILFTNRGANVGTIAIVPDYIATANIGPQLTLVRCNDCILKEYLFQFLRGSFFQKQIQQRDSGSAMNFFGIKDTECFKVLVPSLSEQKRIAQILSTWDKAISVTETLLTNSKQQKKALMQQLLTGRRRLLDDHGVRFSGEWRSGPLGSLVGRIYGGGTPSRANSGLWGGDIPWVTVKDLISPRINGAQEYINEIGLAESASNLVLAGTVIIATRMAVGKTVVASCDVAINQDLKAICASEYVCSEYIFNWFLLHAEQIAKMGTGSTVKGVQVEAIKALNMTIPKAIEEQQKIAAVLSAADAEISTLEKKLTCLKDEKKALMHQLLTGKRRVKVEAEEVVSA